MIFYLLLYHNPQKKSPPLLMALPLRKFIFFAASLNNFYKFYSSLFHKTLPKSGLQMNLTSARFYEMGVISEDG